MRLPNLTAATVFAIATCIGLVRDAQAAAENPEALQQPFQVQPESIPDVDFTAENHGEVKDCEVVNLVCDNLIIDTIYVTTRPVIIFETGLVASNTHHKSKPCSAKKCTNIISTVYIDMDKPCSKKPPKATRTAAVSGDAPSDSVEADSDSEKTSELEEEEDEELLGVSLNGDDQPGDEELSLGKKHHRHHDHRGHHHHGGHRHRHHHRNHPHLHRHRREKGPKHPWINRCVSIGTFCGTHIFGYRFAANAVYTCDKIGGKPKFITACVGGCSNGACIIEPVTTEPATSTTTKTGGPTTPVATTTTDGVTTTAATTTTASAITTTTTKPDCVPLIEPIKDSIRGLLTMVEGLPLGPEASQLLKLALGTNLTAYFDNGVDSAGSIAALLAHTLPQVVDVFKSVQSSLGPTFEITDGAFQVFYDLVGHITKASSSLASCTGAKPDCTGLVTLSGYAVKIGVPIVRAYLLVKFPPAALAFIVLQPTIDKIADSLIQGDDRGISDIIKLIVDATTGTAGSMLPPPLKAILGITKPLLSIIKDCDKTKPPTTTTTVGTTTTAATTDATTATTTTATEGTADGTTTATTTAATTAATTDTTTDATTDATTTATTDATKDVTITTMTSTTATSPEGATTTTTVTATTGAATTTPGTITTAATTTTTDVITTTAATTTTTSAIATTTTTPDCTPLIGPIKDAIRGLLAMIENLPLGPEASQLLKTAVGTNLTAYFDNGVDSAGSVAATLASTLPQIVDVIKGMQTSLGSTFSITDPVFQALYDAVGVFTKATSDLAACTGAKPDCTGLVVMTGYAIKIGWPILRAELAIKFPPSILAFDALQPTVDKISDGLIAGNDAGLTDFLTFITDQTTGLVGAALPAPIKAILDVVKPILGIIKNCPK